MSVEDGLRRAGFELVNTIWSVMYGGYRRKAKADFIAGIRKKAKEEKLNILAASMGAVMKEPEYDTPLKYNADAGIYVVSRISGEGNDRVPEKGDFMLTDSEVRDILAMDEKYEKYISDSGNVYICTRFRDKFDILYWSDCRNIEHSQ